MAESTDIIPFYANPKIVIPVVIIAIAAAVGIPMLLHYLATVGETKKTDQQLKDDASSAKSISATTGIPEGRVSELQNTAHAIYTKMQSYWPVDSTVIVGLLNEAKSDDEMKVLTAFYNNNLVQNGATTLRADIDKRVVGTSLIVHYASASDITYYNDII